MKKPKTKAPRGSVQIVPRESKLALHFRYQGKRYRRSIDLPNTPLGKYQAHEVVKRIERDLNYGEFDPTFTRYLPETPTPETPKLSTLELWQRFTDYRREQGTSGQALTSRYAPIASNLKRFGRDIETISETREFVDLLRTRQSGRTANQNLSLLKGFGTWAVEQGYWEVNHFEAVQPLKAAKGQPPKPFTDQETQAILATAQTDPVAYRYHGFILALLKLGLRPSEAIGLRWKHINLARGEVTICESLSRGADGKAAGGARQRKATKTGNTRTLKLPQSVLIVLQGKLADLDNPSPEDLVFTTAKGRAIDDHTFSQRIWRRVLARAGVAYRRPYNCRHTCLSRALEAGNSPAQVAHIAGHTNIRMVSETYGHMINPPRLPD